MVSHWWCKRTQPFPSLNHYIGVCCVSAVASRNKARIHVQLLPLPVPPIPLPHSAATPPAILENNSKTNLPVKMFDQHQPFRVRKTNISIIEPHSRQACCARIEVVCACVHVSHQLSRTHSRSQRGKMPGFAVVNRMSPIAQAHRYLSLRMRLSFWLERRLWNVNSRSLVFNDATALCLWIFETNN